MPRLKFALPALLAVLLGGFLLFSEYSDRVTPAVSAPAPAPSPAGFSADRSAKILALGDVMFGRNVRVLMERDGGDYPFRQIGNDLQSYDAVIANLEGPAAENATRTPMNSMRFVFASQTIGELRRAGVTAVSLANNHAWDYGEAGFSETERILRDQGLEFFGQPGPAQDTTVWPKTISGQSFQFLAWNATGSGFDAARAGETVAAVRRANPASAIWVSMHWGEEYQPQSGTDQEKLARLLVDRGADIVIGHHPHVAQEIEIYKNRPIFYSLGNFVFDQYFSQETEEGLAVAIERSAVSTTFRLLPWDLNHSQPKPMLSPDRERFLKDLASRSAPELKESILAGRFTLTN